MSLTKKNAIVVIETTSSWTDLKTMKTTEQTYYFVAKASKVVQGKVIEYQKADSPYSQPVDFKTQRVFVIGDAEKQNQAKRLYKELKENWFGNADDVKNAILAA